jgi:potassium inwardly-rectifying channel subfamily J
MVYAATIFVFAFIYLGVSLLGEQSKINPDGTISKLPFCDMDIHNHMEALYFSLSTMTTIGYGVSDYYFGGCWTPLLLVLAQVCCALIFQAVAIGLLFQRISRGHKRSKTILFSDKAVVRRVKGVWYLMVRIGELRSHQLIEATVRAYCIRHERHAVADDANSTRPNPNPNPSPTTTMPRTSASSAVETTHFVTRPVRFLHEESSSHILMSLPQVLVHRMDEKSPLCPPRPAWYDATGQVHGQETLFESQDNKKN